MKATTGILLALLAFVTSCTKEPDTLSGVYVLETDATKDTFDFRSDGTVYNNMHPTVSHGAGARINQNGKGTYKKRGQAIRIIITNEATGAAMVGDHFVSVATNFFRTEGPDLVLIYTNSEGQVSKNRYMRQ